MLKILLITIVLVGIAVAGLGIRLLLEKNGEFSGSNCRPDSKGGDGEQGNSCSCGTGCY